MVFNRFRIAITWRVILLSLTVLLLFVLLEMERYRFSAIIIGLSGDPGNRNAHPVCRTDQPEAYPVLPEHPARPISPVPFPIRALGKSFEIFPGNSTR